MVFSVRRLYRKDNGTYFRRIILGPPASTSESAGQKRAEVRCSLRTTDRDRAIEIAARVNAQLKLARSMTHRQALMNE